MKKQYKTFKEYLKAKYQGPYVATDIIIRYDDGNKKGIVLIDRKFSPLGLALPGGMAERMTLAENAVKEAMEETGLEVVLDDINRPLCVFSDVDQDPREFVTSVTYTGIGRGILRPRPKEDAKSARIYSNSELARLLNKDVWAFPHHKKIISLFLKEEKCYSK